MSHCQDGSGSVQSDLISVIIPAHNAQDYIETAVYAALNQVDVEVEVIVVDDGSVDGTAQKLVDLASRDARVRVLTHAVAHGPSGARNSGMRQARGAWIAILDADDNWRPRRLITLLGEIKRRNLDVIADNQTLIQFETSDILGKAFPDAWLNADLLSVEDLILRDWPGRQRCRPLGNLKIVARREFLLIRDIIYNEKIRVGEDFLFYITLLVNAARFGLHNEELYIYSFRQGSTSSSSSASLRQLLDVNGEAGVLCSRFMANDLQRLREIEAMLHDRAQALNYQVMTQGLKMGDLRLSFSALRSMKLNYALSRLARAALIRLGIWHDDAIMA